MRRIGFRPIWFDSMGAKSSCTLVWTEDVRILIDPGAAIMQPSFPANIVRKLFWLVKARLAIGRAAGRADVVVISHYHYDHFTDFSRRIYEGKLILAKNPNEFINESQRERAESFFSNYSKKLGGVELEKLPPDVDRDYGDPLDRIPLAGARKKDLAAGVSWFRRLSEKWRRWGRIPEMSFRRGRVIFPEGRTIKLGRTRIRASAPFFHGIAFSRVGWVFSTVIERGRERLIHSSDLNGPVIEDYAEWIIEQRPRVLILDGPSTYMLGYLVAKRNLRRAVENVLRILEETDLELLVYDHHLAREPRFRERTAEVWRTGERLGIRVTTAAELLGRKPVCLDR